MAKVDHPSNSDLSASFDETREEIKGELDLVHLESIHAHYNLQKEKDVRRDYHCIHIDALQLGKEGIQNSVNQGANILPFEEQAKCVAQALKGLKTRHCLNALNDPTDNQSYQNNEYIIFFPEEKGLHQNKHFDICIESQNLIPALGVVFEQD